MFNDNCLAIWDGKKGHNGFAYFQQWWLVWLLSV